MEELYLAIKVEFEGMDSSLSVLECCRRLAKKYGVKAEAIQYRIRKHNWTRAEVPDTTSLVEKTTTSQLVNALEPLKAKLPMIEGVHTSFETINFLDAPNYLAKAIEGLEGLKLLDKELQSQAHAIILAVNDKIRNAEDLTMEDLKLMTQLNIDLRNAYFNAGKGGASVNIVNNNDMSSSSLEMFNSFKKKEI